MTVRRRLETALASAAALLSNLRARLSPAPCDLVGAVLCALAALFLILYAASGFSDAPWFAVAGALRPCCWAAAARCCCAAGAPSGPWSAGALPAPSCCC